MKNKEYFKKIDAIVRLKHSGLISNNKMKCPKCSYVGKAIGIESSIIATPKLYQRFLISLKYSLIYFLISGLIFVLFTSPLRFFISRDEWVAIVDLFITTIGIFIALIGIIGGFFCNPLKQRAYMVRKKEFVISDHKINNEGDDKNFLFPPVKGNLTVICPMCGAEYINSTARAITWQDNSMNQ